MYKQFKKKYVNVFNFIITALFDETSRFKKNSVYVCMLNHVNYFSSVSN